MIHDQTGDLFAADVDALVNPVNTKGVMGKGLASQFKHRFPDNFEIYQKECKQGKMMCGRVFVFHRGVSVNPRWIINFPTKDHWRNLSKIEYIQEGLDSLVLHVQACKIRSIAIPALGCGEGGLDWADVEPLIVQAFQGLPHVHVILFPPL